MTRESGDNPNQLLTISNYEKENQSISFAENRDRLSDISLIHQIQCKWDKPKSRKEKELKLKNLLQNDTIRLIDDHKITWEMFLKKHKMREENLHNGLATEEAIKRNLEFGNNVLTSKTDSPWYIKLFREFTNSFALFMWALALTCLLAYVLDTTDPSGLYETIVITVMILLTSILSFFQKTKSDAIMHNFKNYIPQTCVVIRDGKESTIPVERLVQGDLLLIREGQRIPADIRILSSLEMKVDNSSLTGETLMYSRSEKCNKPDKLLETRNVAFLGTLCKHGSGKGIVFNIGNNTVIGHISNLASQSEKSKSPLYSEIEKFIIFLSIFSILCGFLVFILGLAVGVSFVNDLIYGIGVILSNIPQGLMPAMIVALTITAKRLRNQNVLVKNLDSVETLGSTTCICLDKTGTLTQNIMTVDNLWFNLKVVKGLNREKAGPHANYEYSLEDFHFQIFIKAIILNTTAVFSNSMPATMLQKLDPLKISDPRKYEIKRKKCLLEWEQLLPTLPYWKREVIGDASETALLRFVQPIADVEKTREKFTVARQEDGSEAKIPFNSSYKFTLQIIEILEHPSYSYEVLLKGAPERIWEKCEYILHQEKEVRIDERINREFKWANNQFAKKGEHILGFARLLLKTRDYPANFKFDLKSPFDLPFNGFCFIGLVSLIDPPKKNASDVVQNCKAAGIKIIMITGDQQLTATSVAKQIGIFDEKTSLDLAEDEGISNEEAIEYCNSIVVNDEMLTLAAMEDEFLPESQKGRTLEKWLQKSQIVFARTSPIQKLYIVKGCQKLGHLVAMVGDGMNDVPAINQADIGISMGITGSDVAKDAADMVLLDDDFGSIITGIREGRRIFDNIKKLSTYMNGLNVPAGIPFLLAIFMGIPIPINALLLLAIALGTDTFSAIGLAYEEPEIDVMTRATRKKNEGLIELRSNVWSYLQAGILETLGPLIAYFIIFSDFGFEASQLYQITKKPYFPHFEGDVYNTSHPFLGNTNVFCDETNVLQSYVIDSHRKSVTDKANTLNGYSVDWNFTLDSNQDFRIGYLSNNCPSGAKPSMRWKQCSYNQISPISLSPVCYSGEAIRYAQTGYFIALIMNQIFSSIACKTKSQSIITQPIGNSILIGGWIIQIAFISLICYTRILNQVFQSRDVSLFHTGFYGVLTGLLLLIYEEIRKYLIRNFPIGKNENKPNWFALKTLF